MIIGAYIFNDTIRLQLSGIFPLVVYFQVILVTLFSVCMDLKNNYGVKIVDYIPQGYTFNEIFLFFALSGIFP